MLFYNLGVAQETSGQYNAAIESYEKAQKTESFLQQEALLAQGRCYEALKQYKKAQESYQKIKDKYPKESYYKSTASILQEKLKKMVKP